MSRKRCCWVPTPFQAPPSPFPWKKASEALGRRQAVECPVCSPTGIWQSSSLSATLGCDGRKRVSARRDSTRMGSLWGEGAAPQSLLEEGHLGLTTAEQRETYIQKWRHVGESCKERPPAGRVTSRREVRKKRKSCYPEPLKSSVPTDVRLLSCWKSPLDCA